MNYVLKKGQTLSHVAKELNIPLEELLTLNNISKDKANSVKEGQTIKVIDKTSDPYNWRSHLQQGNLMGLGTNIMPKYNPKTEQMGTPYQAGMTHMDYVKTHAKDIQEQLLAEKYSLGKYGADGKWGKTSQAALDKALADGYVLKNGKLVKPSTKATTPSKPSDKPAGKSPSLISRGIAFIKNSFGSDEPESETAPEAKPEAKPIDPNFLKKNAKSIQDQLASAGYDLGSYGPDGSWGNDSQKALDQALADGYTLKDGKLVKKSNFIERAVKASIGKVSNMIPEFVKDQVKMTYDSSYVPEDASKLQAQLMDAGYNIGITTPNGKWGGSSKTALKKAYEDGYIVINGRLIHPTMKVATPGNPGIIGSIKNAASNAIYDNLYPYSYGDVEENGVTRQVTGKDPALTQVKAAINKVTSGIKGMDPRRDIMNQMAALDLNTTEGLEQWKALAKQADNLDHKMVRYRGTTPEQIKNQQWEMRARLDAMNLYQGRDQQWNTYVEQNDDSKKSGRATKAGKPTLVIRNKGQRNRINGEMLNYWNAHPEQRIKGEDGLYRLPVMSYLGNATIVQQADGSLRYTDDWDYTWSSENDPNRPYFGEVLSDYSGKGYGTGVNGRSFHEGMSDILSNIYQQEFASNKEGITGKLLSLFS